MFTWAINNISKFPYFISQVVACHLTFYSTPLSTGHSLWLLVDVNPWRCLGRRALSLTSPHTHFAFTPQLFCTALAARFSNFMYCAITHHSVEHSLDWLPLLVCCTLCIALRLCSLTPSMFTHILAPMYFTLDPAVSRIASLLALFDVLDICLFTFTMCWNLDCISFNCVLLAVLRQLLWDCSCKRSSHCICCCPTWVTCLWSLSLDPSPCRWAEFNKEDVQTGSRRIQKSLWCSPER